jgi:hypothetical protein
MFAEFVAVIDDLGVRPEFHGHGDLLMEAVFLDVKHVGLDLGRKRLAGKRQEAEYAEQPE